MKRAIVIAALMLAFAARAQDAAPWWNALATDEKLDVLDGLVGWWKLDGNTLDSVGTNNGVAYGAVPTNDFVKGAYSFNGVSGGDYISINFESLKFPYLSWSAWVKPRVVVSYGKIICLCYRESTWSPPYISFVMVSSDSSTGNPVAKIAVDGISVPSSGNSGTALALNTWSFLMATYDGSRLCMYQNGALKTVSNVTGVVDYGASKYLAIGTATPLVNQENFSGLISDVRIYNRALSSNEVATIYNRYK